MVYLKAKKLIRLLLGKIQAITKLNIFQIFESLGLETDHKNILDKVANDSPTGNTNSIKLKQ